MEPINEEEMDEFEQSSPTAFLRSFSIDGLFGHKSVNIFLETPESSMARSINILYGTNGSGKTTILKFIYFFLSPQDSKGYKTWISNLPFVSAVFEFKDGRSFVIEKDTLVGSYVVRYIFEGKEELFNVVCKDGVVKKDAEGADVGRLLLLLDSMPFDLFYISDSRQYFTTSNYINQTSARRPARRRVVSAGGEYFLDSPAEEQSISISEMSAIITEVFRRRVLRTGASSQRNTNSIYRELVSSILSPLRSSELAGNKRELLDQISHTKARIDSAVKMGAMPDIDSEFYEDAVNRADQGEVEKLSLIVSPYLNSLNARAITINPSIDRMNSLIGELNRFYSDKVFSFSMRTGFSILSRETGGPVEFDWLSSGERQLFIILSSVFLTYEATGIVLIDEPELSLNILWQREFVRSLQRVTEGSSVQYILASHSPEILSSESANVISSGH